MDEKNCEALFEYLRSILYDPKAKQLDIETLDEPFRKLGMGLQFLDHAVREMKDYTAALSVGKLSVPAPARDNFLCENLKSLHANLNHLTWQAKQVANGDYAQSVSYMGEFSESFNAMVEQLRERDAKLKAEAELVRKHLDVVEGYNKLLIELIARSEEDVIVTSAKRHEILYCTKENVQENIQDNELYGIILERQKKKEARAEQFGEHEWTWEVEDSYHRYYRITTARMEWQGEQAYAHIILELTHEHEEQGRWEMRAYSDALTSIGNRSYFLKQLEELLETGEALVICYCDLDHLKYVNDHHGHAEGDAYICSFVASVQQFIRDDDVFTRLGGDEFCIIFRDCLQDAVEERMQEIQNEFAKGYKPYAKSFSYGLVQVPEGHRNINIDEMMDQADYRMYQQKKAHRNART